MHAAATAGKGDWSIVIRAGVVGKSITPISGRGRAPETTQIGFLPSQAGTQRSRRDRPAQRQMRPINPRRSIAMIGQMGVSEASRPEDGRDAIEPRSVFSGFIERPGQKTRQERNHVRPDDQGPRAIHWPRMILLTCSPTAGDTAGV